MRRLEELQRESGMLRAAFPELFDGRAPGASVERGKSAAPAAKATPKRRRRRMSAAARKAVSERMTKFWADRRKSKSKSKGKA
jgi:hypothetical protein